MVSRITIVIVLLIVTARGAALCLAATGPSENRVHAEVDLRGTKAQPLVATTDPSSVTEEDLRRDREHAQERGEDSVIHSEERRERSIVDKWTIAIALLTAAILLVQAGAFVYQSRELHRSVTEMKAATSVAESAARMARRSARAAARANQLNWKALAADQRPWIALGSEPQMRFARGQDCWSFSWECPVTNTGKTPAQNVYVSAVVLRQPGGAADAEHERLCTELINHSSSVGSVVFPGEQRTLVASALLPDEWLNGCASGSPINYRVVILGCVYYRFALEDSVHVTGFRYGLSRNGSVVSLPSPAPSTWSAEIFGTYRHERGWFAT